MNRKQLRRYHLGLFVAFFVLGVFWGRYFYYGEENKLPLFKKASLVLLSEEGFLPMDLVENLMLRKDTPALSFDLEIKTYKDIKELSQALATQKFDLIAYKSYYAQKLLDGRHIQKISNEFIKNEDAISIDFKNPPYDRDGEYAVPLFWGISKMNLSESSFPASILWTENISLAATTTRLTEAYEFINYILLEETAADIVRIKNVATTNILVEGKSDISESLKPSYLRKVSIQNLKYGDKVGLNR